MLGPDHLRAVRYRQRLFTLRDNHTITRAAQSAPANKATPASQPSSPGGVGSRHDNWVSLRPAGYRRAPARRRTW